VPLFDSKIKEHLFYEELDYWQIHPSMLSGESDDAATQKFDIQWCAHTLKLDSTHKRVQKSDN